jgi:hypothetical protein
MSSNIIYNNIQESIIRNDDLNLEYIEYNSNIYPWKLNSTFLSHDNNSINIPQHTFIHNNYFLIESKTSDIKLKTIDSKRLLFDSPGIFKEDCVFKNIDASNLSLQQTLIANYIDVDRINVKDLYITGILNLNTNRTNIRGDINLEGSISINGNSDLTNQIGTSNTNIKFANITNSIIGQNGPDLGFFTNIKTEQLTCNNNINTKNVDCSDNAYFYKDLYVSNSLILKSIKLENLYTYYNFWEIGELSLNYIVSPSRYIAIEDSSKNKININNYRFLLKKGKYLINTGILNTGSNEKIYKYYSYYVGFEVYQDLSYNFKYNGVYNRSDILTYSENYSRELRGNNNIENFYRGEIEIEVLGNFGYANISVYHADTDHVNYNSEYNIEELLIYEHDINILEEFSILENKINSTLLSSGSVLDTDNNTRIVAERFDEINTPLDNNQLDFYTNGIRRLQIDECGNILYGNLYKNPITENDYNIKIDFSNGTIISKSDISCNNIIANKFISHLDISSTNILSNEISCNNINIHNDISINNNLFINGNIYGPSNMIIDPSLHNDNSGTLIIKGNLIVEGNETVINSNIIDISDYRILLSTSYPNKNGAGIEVSNNKLFVYDSSFNSWSSNINLSCANDTYLNNIFINNKLIISSQNSEIIDFTNRLNDIKYGFFFDGDISVNNNNILSSKNSNLENINNDIITVSNAIKFQELTVFSNEDSNSQQIFIPTIERDDTNLNIMNFNKLEIKNSHNVNNDGLSVKTNLTMNDFDIKNISTLSCNQINSGNISCMAINTNNFLINSGPITCTTLNTNNNQITTGAISCTTINTNDFSITSGPISSGIINTNNNTITCGAINTNNNTITCGAINSNNNINCGTITCNTINTNNNDMNAGTGKIVAANLNLTNLTINSTISNNTLTMEFNKMYAVKDINYDGIISTFDINNTNLINGSQIIIKIKPSDGSTITIYGYENPLLLTKINNVENENIIINFAEDLELEGDGYSSIIITAINISNVFCISASIFKKKSD